jgi:NAD(P)-dependent dehydrogenase (short-subunit alcohol dehydrogenase family)
MALFATFHEFLVERWSHSTGARKQESAGFEGRSMDIKNKVAVITGAASGIGRELATALAEAGARGLALVDRSDAVVSLAVELAKIFPSTAVRSYVWDVASAEFRVATFADLRQNLGSPTLCIPAAGIAVPNQLAVKLDRDTGKAALYTAETIEMTHQVNTVAAVYWALETIAAIAEDRHRRGLKRWSLQEAEEGVIVLIGSIFSRGARGQLAYAMTKGAITAAAGTLRKEAIHFGVRCVLIHPGFVDTPMVRAMGEDFIAERILPNTRLGRLIRPVEIARAICFQIENPAAETTQWVDAGWNDPG